MTTIYEADEVKQNGQRFRAVVEDDGLVQLHAPGETHAVTRTQTYTIRNGVVRVAPWDAEGLIARDEGYSLLTPPPVESENKPTEEVAPAPLPPATPEDKPAPPQQVETQNEPTAEAKPDGWVAEQQS